MNKKGNNYQRMEELIWAEIIGERIRGRAGLEIGLE